MDKIRAINYSDSEEEEMVINIRDIIENNNETLFNICDLWKMISFMVLSLIQMNYIIDFVILFLAFTQKGNRIGFEEEAQRQH